MKKEIICAGFGGQGILLAGKFLAFCAMKENKYSTWMSSYGAEVRGGTAYSMTIISDESIPSPVVNSADGIIVMNEPSFRKFKPRVKQDGLLIVNSSLVKNIPKSKKIIKFPFTDIAVSLGNVKVANMVAVGAYLKKTKVLSIQTALKAIEEFVNDKKLVVLNKLAILKGASLIKG
ncbi:MAG: 2-oxoacid:acceptor oxidoreductase family protein [Candidatus Omnitrophica bacterium]|nr:2-oxoacid:acceptor oxidoreductase family protein [Candidatus Omnitrophota bacterium]